MSRLLLNALAGTLLLWTLPLLAAASELGHVMQGLEYVALFFGLLLAVLFGIGFVTRFFVWPTISTPAGKAIAGLLAAAVAWLVVLAIVWWLKS